MSQSDSSSQSEKDDQVDDDGSEYDDNSDNNDGENDNENNEKKAGKGRRRKLKRKKLNRYFNDDSVKIEIKNDKIVKDIHKYKVAFTIGEKTFKRWIPEKIVLEKANEALNQYNSKPKKIKKRKIKRIIRKQQKHTDEIDDNKNEYANTANDNDDFESRNEEKIIPKEMENPSILPIKLEKNKVKQPKEHNIKSDTIRPIEKILAMKKRENTNFPDFIVKFTDSDRFERVSWKKIHTFYKSNLLSFYEEHISSEELRPISEFPDGLQVEEKLHYKSNV